MDMLVDTSVDMHVHMCHPHIQRHTLPTNTSLFAPHPLPPTLPHTHKICLNYPGVLSPTCLPILLFLQKVFSFFLLCSYSITLFLGAHASAQPTSFLLFPFLLGCFTQLRTVYFGKASMVNGNVW